MQCKEQDNEEGYEMRRKLSKKEKVVIGISALAAVSAVTVLILILVNGGFLNTDGSVQAEKTADAHSVTEVDTHANGQDDGHAALAPSGGGEVEGSEDEPLTQESPVTTETFLAYIVDWTGVDFSQVSFAFVKIEIDENEGDDSPFVLNEIEAVRWYYTVADTEFLIFDPYTSFDLFPVERETFLNATEDWVGNNPGLTRYVQVTVSGETIISIEWFYTPWAG